jgi:nitrate reductase NapAB chaperone NapD
MAIASFIVKTKADFVEEAVTAIESMGGLTVHTVTENQEIIVLAEAPTLEEVSQLGEAIQGIDENIWSVTCAYANNETDEELDQEYNEN